MLYCKSRSGVWYQPAIAEGQQFLLGDLRDPTYGELPVLLQLGGEMPASEDTDTGYLHNPEVDELKPQAPAETAVAESTESSESVTQEGTGQ
jgi:hypothetical protein